MIPVIAIVGRPNVGKSTLFNRLTGSRAALVSDLPGMTRDRQYGEATVLDHRFIVIDTGGLTGEKDNLNQLTEEQVLLAVDEADCVLFVVDGRAGITPADQSIAEKIRTRKQAVFLVVNKTEGLDNNVAAAEFYSLGFGKPSAVSSAHNSGIEDLVDTVFEQYEPTLEEEFNSDQGLKLAIVGRPNVGKSTLTNRMLGEARVIVSDIPGTTRDSIFIPLERFNVKYTLIDTAGVRSRGKVTETPEKFSVVKTLQAIEATHVVLFLMDAREGVTDQDLRLLGFILESGKALVIGLNKWDGLTNDEKDHARASVDRRLNFVPFARIHFISALKGTGIGSVFNSINEAYDSATKKMTTSILTKILQEAIASHNPPLVHGRRIKLRYAHAGGHNPPLIIIHGNQVDALPDSYRRYLSSVFQKKLKLVGTPVQVELKSGENPYRFKRNTLTPRQLAKKKRLMSHVKK